MSRHVCFLLMSSCLLASRMHTEKNKPLTFGEGLVCFYDCFLETSKTSTGSGKEEPNDED